LLDTKSKGRPHKMRFRLKLIVEREAF
jgi:hypothetical protein